MPTSSDDRYDPGADAASRLADWVIRHRDIAPIPEVLCVRRKVILLDASLSLAVRRSALAHAIAHVDLGHVPESGRQGRRYEREADRLAAERLLPLPALVDALRWALGPDEVAHELDVTEHMVKVRVQGLSAMERRLMETMLDAA